MWHALKCTHRMWIGMCIALLAQRYLNVFARSVSDETSFRFDEERAASQWKHEFSEHKQAARAGMKNKVRLNQA